MRLAKLLKAKQPDLLDGFPLKAAFKALSAKGTYQFKLAYLNELLEDEDVEVALTSHGNLLPGFHEVGISGALTYSDGSIEVKVTRAFFKHDQTPIERALRFQSIVAHELVHREQFNSSIQHALTLCADDELTTIEYLNDQSELEGIAAEIAHDALTQKFTNQPMELAQPRLSDIMNNLSNLKPEGLEYLRRAVESMKA